MNASGLLRLYLHVLPVAFVADALILVVLSRWLRGRRR